MHSFLLTSWNYCHNPAYCDPLESGTLSTFCRLASERGRRKKNRRYLLRTYVSMNVKYVKTGNNNDNEVAQPCI